MANSLFMKKKHSSYKVEVGLVKAPKRVTVVIFQARSDGSLDLVVMKETIYL